MCSIKPEVLAWPEELLEGVQMEVDEELDRVIEDA